MSGKRGRPLKYGDHATVRRRQLTLQRVRRFNERRKALLVQTNAHSTPLHEAHANEAEQRMDEAAATLMQLRDSRTPPMVRKARDSTAEQDGSGTSSGSTAHHSLMLCHHF